MGGVRVDAANLFTFILDRIADEGLPSGLSPVSCALELDSENLPNPTVHDVDKRTM